jgi:hypothetical protein
MNKCVSLFILIVISLIVVSYKSPLLANVSQSDSKDQTFSFDTVTVLRNGKILAIADCKNLASIYDPVLKVWTKTAPPISRRAQFRSTLLNNGKVLVSGGTDCSGKALKTVRFMILLSISGQYKRHSPMLVIFTLQLCLMTVRC